MIQRASTMVLAARPAETHERDQNAPKRRPGRRRPQPRHSRDRPDAVAHPAQSRPPHRAAAPRRSRGDPRRGDAGARGDRHRFPQRRSPGLSCRRRLRRPPGQRHRAHGPRLRDGADRQGPRAVRHHAAQPRPPHHARRQSHVLRQRLLATQRDGSRPRPAARRHGGDARPAEIHPVFQLHPRRRRLSGGTRRHPPLGAPPRLPLREAHPHRQGRARLFARSRTRRGRDRDGPHRQRPLAIGLRERTAALHQHQLLEPAQARLADARRRDALRPPRPARHRHALHAGRRDGPGHHGRRRGAIRRRGAGRHRAPAGHPPRPALHDRQLHLERRHEVRRPGLRHARNTSAPPR